MTESRRIVAVSHACVRSINRAIYRRLVEMGWEVHLVIPKQILASGKQLMAEPAMEADRNLVSLELDGENPRTYLFRGLEELVTKIKPDIVFLEVDPVSKLAIRQGRQGRVEGFATACLSCENLAFDMFAAWKRQGITKVPASAIKTLLAWRARKLIDHVFTINNDGLQLFRQLKFRSVSKIPLGFDPAFFHIEHSARQRIRDKYGLSGIVFAYFGRLIPEKGVHLMLESLRRLKSRDWLLMLDQFESHSSEYASQIQRLIDQFNFRHQIRFIQSSHGEISNFMNAADVVVLPSISKPNWREQYGRVAPEAMACGKTIVAFRSGALPELIGNFGYLIDEGDVDRLACVLEGIVEKRVPLKDEGETAKYARANLSVDIQAEKMNEHFLSIIYGRS